MAIGVTGLVQSVKNFIGMGGSNEQQLIQQAQGTDNPLEEIVYKEELVTMVNNCFDSWARERKPYDLQWDLNREFYNNNQYCDINLDSMTIDTADEFYPFQQRMTFNQIRPIIDTRLSKLERVQPSLKTRPATGERKNVSKSKVSSSLVKGTWANLKMQDKLKEASAWMEITGTVFLKYTWNPSAGRQIASVNDGEKQQPVKEGDIACTVVPSYEIYPDSQMRPGMEAVKRFIHAKAFHIDEIEEKWGVQVQGREVDVFNSTREKYTDAFGNGYSSLLTKKTKVKEHEIVIEYHELPTKKYPKGRILIVAGKELLYSGDYPFLVGEDGTHGIPFVRIICKDNPGCFWGSTVIENIIDPQKGYNAIKNRKAEFINRAAIGVLTYEEGSIDSEQVENDGWGPGTTLPFAPGHQPPHFLENGSLPAEVEMEERNYKDDFTTMSGVSVFSRESVPPVGSGSGISLEIIREQDDTRLSRTASNIRSGSIDAGKIILRLYKQFVKTPRELRYVVGDDIEILEWQESDITTFDVVLETENELAQTPAQRKQFVFDLDDRGLFNDPETGKKSKRGQAKMFAMLKLEENWEEFDDVDERQIKRAQRENALLLKGQQPQTREIDDDAIHIEEHIKFMLSTEYEELLEDNPQAAAALEMHRKLHEKMQIWKQVQKQQQAMQAQMAMMPPGLVPPGGPGQGTTAVA